VVGPTIGGQVYLVAALHRMSLVVCSTVGPTIGGQVCLVAALYRMSLVVCGRTNYRMSGLPGSSPV